MTPLDPAIVATLRRTLTSDSRVVERMMHPGTDFGALESATGLSQAQLETLTALPPADLAAVFEEVRATRAPAMPDGSASGALFITKASGAVPSPTGVMAARAAALTPVPTATFETIPFDTAMKVSPSQDPIAASKLVVGIPAFAGEALVYPKTYPSDMRNKDGSPHPDRGTAHPEAGKPILYKGAPYLDAHGAPALGVVVYNYEDNKFQGLVTNGNTVLLFNQATEELAHKITAWVRTHGVSSVESVQRLLSYAMSLGASDRYPSDLGFVGSKLVPNAGTAAEHGPPLGLFTRRREEQRAVFVEGPAKVDELVLGREGGVFLDVGPGKKARHVSPAAFAETFTHLDGSPIEASELPRVRLNSRPTSLV